MAKTTKNLLILSTFLLISSAHASVDESENFYKRISPKSLGLNFKSEKLSHLHFYFHDTLSGSNPTAIPVAKASSTNSSKSLFGLVTMMDDPLTTGPEPNSTVVGRAQGIYASASQTEISYLMVLNYVFTQGEYNGSTLSVLGRNSGNTFLLQMGVFFLLHCLILSLKYNIFYLYTKSLLIPYISSIPQSSVFLCFPFEVFTMTKISHQNHTSILLLLSIVILSFIVTTTTTAKPDEFSRILAPATLGLKREKLSHLHFYFHDIVSGKNPTAVTVAQAPTTNLSPTGFGSVVMIDDPLTVTPEPTSKIVGRAQGIYASASQTEFALLMTLNFAFVEGKYNGSTLAVLGRNRGPSDREMPIVGGSGLFRFARGYAQARTHTFNPATGDAVVEYNVYVFHY